MLRFPWIFPSLSPQALTKCALLIPEIQRSMKSVAQGSNVFITQRPTWSSLPQRDGSDGSDGEREEEAHW